MRILVTGSNGFMGGHLVDALEKAGHEVICHTQKQGDISGKNALDFYENVDHVYHLAARTFVPSSWEHAHDYFQTNIMGTVTVLEYCRLNKCSATMLSTYVYGEPQYLPVDEDHPVIGMSPYHESKIVCEELCRFYSSQFGLKISILRPFNVYGKGQNETFLLPLIMKQVLDDDVKSVEVMDLEPKRDYVYIDDVISALVATLNATNQYAVYNVGSGVSTSVEEIIKLIMQVSGIKKPYHATDERRTGEISDCVADITRIRRDIKFVPRYSLKDGLAAWIKAESEQGTEHKIK